MASGVRNSCETLATKSCRTTSSCLMRVMSWKTTTAPPTSSFLVRIGTTLISKWRGGSPSAVLSSMTSCWRGSPRRIVSRTIISTRASRNDSSTVRPSGLCLQVEEIEQLVVHQPHDMALVDHHHALDHVGQQHVQVEVLLLLLALKLLQARAHGLQVARHLLDQRRPVDVIRLRPLAGGQLPGQPIQLAERKPVAIADESPECRELDQFQSHQKRDPRDYPGCP